MPPCVTHDGGMTSKEMKRIRARLGCTQEELAAELGIDRSRITRYENGADNIPESRAKSLLLIFKVAKEKGIPVSR